MNKIKNGEITKETCPKVGEIKQSFLFCLLNKEERKKLRMKDENFLKTFSTGERCDVPNEEWKKSEYKHLKYSKSLTIRQSTFVDI